MPPRRRNALGATALAVWSLALATAAQETPPVPSKTLPEAGAPAGAPGQTFVSPRTGASYAAVVEPDATDSDRDDDEAAPADEAGAPAPEAAPAPAVAAGTGAIPKSEFYKNGAANGARRAAKLSVASAPVETFNDLNDLLATLPSKTSMVNHNPPITTQPNSNRVAEERRNVRVRCWLYAHSHEDDNDYHLILGRAPGLTPARFMTMEVSGLPPINSASFATLKAARDTYKNFFGSSLPGDSYTVFRTPVPVLMEGSLFFDMSHATGTPPGPQRFRPNMPTIWEVHPLTRIVFEPQGPPA
jgi:hypothetical protein